VRIEDEEEGLRSVTAQNAVSIRQARQRAERDLLEAKEALERRTGELASSLAMLQATLESTTDGIIVMDEQRGVRHFNEKYADMWGLRPAPDEASSGDAVRNHTCAQFSDPAGFLARMEQIYAAPRADSFDILELMDGRVLERHSRPQLVGDRVVGRVWSFRDITGRRKAERALEEETRVLDLLNRTFSKLASNLDLQSLLQSVTDAATQLSGAQFGAFFYNTTDSSGESYMLYTLSGAPRAAFETFGHPRATPLFGATFRGEGPIRSEDILSDPRYGRWPPHHGMPKGHLPVRSYLAVPVISRSAETIGGLFFGDSRTGVFTERAERVIVGLAAQAAVAIDNARMFESATTAAEERKQLLESERVARSAAERASSMKDEFLATLSHELRTPLSAILGWAQVLRVGSLSSADIEQGVESIERNARAQTQLIDDLLDMSRITSGKMRLDVQEVEPAPFIEAAIETLRYAMTVKGIRLEKVLDPSARPISGDPGRLQQVVWNLLSNAIKFTPRGGKIQVTLQRVNSHIEIGVADTGIGITPEFLPLVFERFRQADASTTRSYSGLGLGLAIARQLVELHGGSVSVSSPGENKGSTFTVKLPLTIVHRRPDASERMHPRGPRAPATDLERPDLSGIRVLVVDDEPDSRALLQRVLSECGAVLMTADSAAQALRVISQERPDVLISDIGMPEVDGYELLRRVRASGGQQGGIIPAIALTAFARTEDRTRALRAGFLVHLAKPVEMSELIATVATIAGRAPDGALR